MSASNYIILNSRPVQNRWRTFFLTIIILYVIMNFAFCFALCVVTTRLGIETKGKSYELPGTNTTIPIDDWPYRLREDVMFTSLCSGTYVILAILSTFYIVQAPRKYIPFTINLLWLVIPFCACLVSVSRYSNLNEDARDMWDTVSHTFRDLYYMEYQVLGVTAVSLISTIISLHPKVRLYFTDQVFE